MSEATPRFDLPLLVPGQAHKEVVHNEALLRLDALLNATVEALADSPPVQPSVGSSWVVGQAPTGAWQQHSGEIAYWQEGGWTFLPPSPGFVAWSHEHGSHILFDGAEWRTETWPVRSLEVGGKVVISGRQAAIPGPSGGAIADTEARAVISDILFAMRSHGLIES